MMLAVFFLLLFTAVDGDESSEKVCNYQDVLNYLNLTKSNELFSMTRPVKDHRNPTWVSLHIRLYAILDVREIDQTFVTYVWIEMTWGNEHISWNKSDFCGIQQVILPAAVLWKPDITIEEMVEKDKASPSPHLILHYFGIVEVTNEQVVVSTCRMHIYYFPFDTQSCNLTFKSLLYPAPHQLVLKPMADSSFSTELSRDVMRTQFEWLFINMNVTEETGMQDKIIYTINMKRRPVLYIVNFLLPVLFFLCLDLASFLISDTGGEKIGFKVTLLLSVTVMQLILNDILPSTTDRVPLIAVYCIGIFSLMMLSLLKTILVMYLLEKDKSQSEDCGDKQDKVRTCNCLTDVKKWTRCGYDVSTGETPSELRSVAKEGSGRKLMEDSVDLEKVSGDLREIEKTLSLLLKKEEGKPGYWCKMVEKINKVFFICYITVAIVFIVVIFSKWLRDGDENGNY